MSTVDFMNETAEVPPWVLDYAFNHGSNALRKRLVNEALEGFSRAAMKPTHLVMPESTMTFLLEVAPRADLLRRVTAGPLPVSKALHLIRLAARAKN